MEMSCDPEKAYSEDCCELSGVVSLLPFGMVSLFYQRCVCSLKTVVLPLCPWQCGGYAEIGLTAGRASCKCMHGQPGIQGPPGPKVNVLCHDNTVIRQVEFPLRYIYIFLCSSAGSQRSSWRSWRPRKTRKLGKYMCNMSVTPSELSVVLREVCSGLYAEHPTQYGVKLNCCKSHCKCFKAVESGNRSSSETQQDGNRSGSKST